jgi:hypothetical protein
MTGHQLVGIGGPLRANFRLVQCNKRGALVAIYSITSSAATWSVSGTARPSAFAVLR